MKLIIISDDSGNRLWPLSSSSCAKPYIAALEGPNGEPESTLQRVWRQLEAEDLSKHARFVTCRQQLDLLRKQVGANVPFTIKPEQRGSYSAIALTASYLYSVVGVSLNETVIVLPSNIFVEASYYHFIRGLPQLLSVCDSQLLMVGISPCSPDSQYDYIVPDKGHGNKISDLIERRVQCFKERPCEAEAKAYIEQGAYWNCGTYAFRLEFMISYLMERGLPVQYADLYNDYTKLPKLNFETEVISKTEVSKSVILYNGLWKKMNSWRTLTENLAVLV